MRIVVAESAPAAARVVADLVERFVRTVPQPDLGLATGATMEPVFAELVRRHREHGLSFARVRAYLLDEYVGLAPDDPCAYRNVVNRLGTGQVDIGIDAVHVPDPHAADLAAECTRYEHQVRKASIGLQLLGIGANGHIAFNEPGSPLDSTTRVVELSEQTRADNARFFPAGRAVPSRAITQGISTISVAAKLVLIACGKHKAPAIASAIEGRVTSEAPASIIQVHPDAIIVLDPSAASVLTKPGTATSVVSANHSQHLRRHRHAD